MRFGLFADLARRLAVASATVLLLVSVVPAAAAVDVRAENVWQGTLGIGGANGTATLRSFSNGAGSVALALKGVTASTRSTASFSVGSCAKPGRRLVAWTVTSTRTGGVRAIQTLSPGAMAQVRGAAAGGLTFTLGSGASR